MKKEDHQSNSNSTGDAALLELINERRRNRPDFAQVSHHFQASNLWNFYLEKLGFNLSYGKRIVDLGKVSDFEVHENIFSCKVEGGIGHIGEFFKCELEFEKAPRLLVHKLVDEVVKSSYILCDLKQGILTSDLIDLAQKLGIKLFPKELKDMPMYCSCHSEKKPCAHLNALIYLTCRQMRLDPFYIFKIRGIDLVREVEEREILISKIDLSYIPTCHTLHPAKTEIDTQKDQILIDDHGAKLDGDNLANLNKVPTLDDLAVYPIPNLKDTVLSLYDDYIDGFITYYNDKFPFKESLKTVFELLEKHCKYAISHKFKESFNSIFIIDDDGPCFKIREKADDIACFVSRNANIIDFTYAKFLPSQLAQRTKNEQCYIKVDLIACQLLLNGAVIPQFYKLTREYQVRFIPAIIDPQVKKLVTDLGRCLQEYHQDFFTSVYELEPLYLGIDILSKIFETFLYKVTNKEEFFSVFNDYANTEFLYKAKPCNLVQAEAPLIASLDKSINVTDTTAGDLYPVIKIEECSSSDEQAKSDQEAQEAQYDEYGVDPTAQDKDNTLDYHEDEYAVASNDDDSFTGDTLTDDTLSDAYDYKEPYYNTKALGSVNGANELHDKSLEGDSLVKEDETEYVYISLGFNVEGEFTPYHELLSKHNPMPFIKLASLICKFIPDLNEVVNEGTKHVKIDLNKLQQVLFETMPLLKFLGISFDLPLSLSNILKPQVKLKIDQNFKMDNLVSFFGLQDLLQFDWQLAVGDKQLTEKDIEYLRANTNKLVKLDDKFVFISAEDLEKLLKYKQKCEKRKLSGAQLLSAAIAGGIDEAIVENSREVEKSIEHIFETKHFDVPSGINATLRDYQVRGYEWLTQNVKAGIGSIIADDMGLGKTLQVIAVIEKLREEGQLENNPVLIVVPTALIINWQHEIKKFAPRLTYSVAYGGGKLDETKHIVLTTYGKLRNDVTQFDGVNYRLLVIDEAQAIKNSDTQTRKSLCQIKANGYIAMSGTPVENRLKEYWSILDFVNPGLFGTEQEFIHNYAKPIEVDDNKEALERFNRVSRPFIIRRLKSDKAIIKDLPEKIVSDRYCSLSPAQGEKYQELVDDALEKLRLIKLRKLKMNPNALLLKMITALKLVCNAPCCYEEDLPHDVEASGKGLMLMEILKTQFENGNKVLIFTQYVKAGNLIVEWIKKEFDIKASFIYGGQSVKERQSIVDSFQTNPNDKVLVLSLRAAGVGLNLTAANTVIHFDLWWNPAVENQATDRAYRIGQKDDVNVVRLICANTFEDKIDEIIDKKKNLAQKTVAVGENYFSDMSVDEIKDIFSLS